MLKLTFVNKTFQEELINMVVLDSFRHLFVEIPRLAGRHLLNIDSFVTTGAKLALLEQLSIIGAIFDFLLFDGLIHFFNKF